MKSSSKPDIIKEPIAVPKTYKNIKPVNYIDHNATVKPSKLKKINKIDSILNKHKTVKLPKIQKSGQYTDRYGRLTQNQYGNMLVAIIYPRMI